MRFSFFFNSYLLQRAPQQLPTRRDDKEEENQMF